MSFHQIRRAARNLAISSKKSECELKKKLRRGANSSTRSPRFIASSTYAIPSAMVKASSCTAVEPASRMWYPLIETVFQRGISRVPNSIVSVTRRSDGSGGKRNSFWATYSLRMSFWSVPSSDARGKPRFSAAAMYMAQIGAAGELMVIEVLTRSSGRPSSRTSMSANELTATPQVPNSPSASGSSVS